MKIIKEAGVGMREEAGLRYVRVEEKSPSNMVLRSEKRVE